MDSMKYKGSLIFDSAYSLVQKVKILFFLNYNPLLSGGILTLKEPRKCLTCLVDPDRSHMLEGLFYLVVVLTM